MTDAASNSATTPSALSTLRLRSPADLVEAVPYLVGFHPEHSVVSICLSRRRKLLTLSMRLDLPPRRHAVKAAEVVARHVRGSGGDTALVACYPEGEDERMAAAHVVEALRSRADQAGFWLKEAVRVENARWWSYLCSDPRCCPPEGTAVATEPGQVAAAAVLSGHVALPSRAALAERLQPVNQIAQCAVLQAMGEARAQIDDASWPGFAAQLLRRYERRQGRLSPAEAARLLGGLHDVALRDGCAEWWYDRRRGEAAVALWTDAVRHAPPGYVAAPATLLAVSAWLCGEGAYGNIALDRALADDPSYRLALLMDAVIQSGVSPSQFRATRFDPGEGDRVRPRRQRQSRRR